MAHDKLKTRARGAVVDGPALRRLAGDIGAAAHRGDVETLAVIRCAMAEVEAGDPFVRGYRAALADTAAAIERELQHRAQDLAEEALVRSRKHFGRALATLRAMPCTGVALTAHLDIDKSQASTLLAELRRRGLAEPCTGAESDPRARPHALTLRGERLAARLSAAQPSCQHEALLRESLPRLLELLAQGRTVRRQDCVTLTHGAGDAATRERWGSVVFDAIGASPVLSREGSGVRRQAPKPTRAAKGAKETKQPPAPRPQAVQTGAGG